MKQKLTNVLLSIAAAAAMMFSAAACGAKTDDAQNTAANVPAATQQEADTSEMTQQETVVNAADTDETKDADENREDASEGKMTLEEWTKTDECAEILREMKEDVTAGQDVEVFFEVEDDEISMVFRYGLQSVEGAGEELAELFRNKTYAAVFEQIRDYYVEVTGNQNVVFKVIFRNADDSEIFSKKFSNAAEETMPLEEWTKKETWTWFMDEMNGELEGVSYSYEVDGDVIIVMAQFDKRYGNIADLGGEKREAYDEYMKTLADSIVELAEAICDEIIDETGNENVVLRLEFRDVNNSLLYSYDF